MQNRIQISFSSITLAIGLLVLSAVQSRADQVQFGFTGVAQLGFGQIDFGQLPQDLLTFQLLPLARMRLLL